MEMENNNKKEKQRGEKGDHRSSGTSAVISGTIPIPVEFAKYPAYKHIPFAIGTKPVTLRIFDFDGTLFRSPVPNPRLWRNSVYGCLKGAPKSGGLAWYQDVLTLQPPYVPIPPPIDYYNKDLLRIIKEGASDPHVRNVLLTGRLETYRPSIEAIVKHAELVFHEMGLKPEALADEDAMPTLVFKMEFIVGLINKYKADRLEIWEDRPKHSVQFENYFNWVGIECKVTTVPALQGKLDQQLEIELVQKLVEKYKPGAVLEPEVAYTGVLLDEESRKKLLSTFKVPDGWQIHCDHMTIRLGPLKEKDSEKLGIKVGDRMKMKVISFGISDEAMAVAVDGPSHNEIPHITIAVSPSGKARDSNDIKEWTPISEDIYVEGIVEQRVVMDLRQEPKRNKKEKTPPAQKINFGKLIGEECPHLRGKQIGQAIAEVKQWMQKMKIQDSVENLDAVREFIKISKF